jgi:hypothetical protein
MSKESINKKVKKTRVFYENPYELETMFESLSVASYNDKELIFMDRFISELRSNPSADLTAISYRILRDLNLIKIPL